MPIFFEVVAVNPNDSAGGGGTLSAEMHDADARGPYFVWPATEMDSAISPHVVVAASEVRAMAARLDAIESGREQPLAGGEQETHPDLVPVNVTGAGEGRESPEYDLADPDAARAYFEALRG